MKIKRFTASNVHGYLNLDVAFFPDLTFLTGINGSGKTTVVNGISALISPSLQMLANTSYVEMKVEIEHQDRLVTIWSVKDEDTIKLGSSELTETLDVPILPREAFDSVPSYRAREETIKYYREQEALWSSHPLLRLVKSLPTPMFLDIERRIEDMPHERTIGYSTRRRAQNVFSSSLSRSLLEATSLAEGRFRRVQARQRELTDKLRKNIILSAVQYESGLQSRNLFPDLGQGYLEAKKNQVTSTLQMLGLSEAEVGRQLEPFFDKLKQLADQLPANQDLGLMILEESQRSVSVSRVQAIVDWMANKPQFDRIVMISRHADEYVKDSQKLSEPIDAYLATVNLFLHDSGKTIGFDETGALSVTISDSNMGPITSLSSGESQIVVILTHLTFNPAARAANVFIVDEPELSLHVRWQELFVQAVRASGPELQVILATHSPSIILEETAHCVELAGGNQ